LNIETQNTRQDAVAPMTATVNSLRRPRRSQSKFLFMTMLVASAVMLVTLLSVPMDKTMVGVVVIVLTVTLMMAGAHIVIAMIVPSIAGLWVLGGWRTLSFALESLPAESAASWTLTVIPMFVFMGMMMSNSGLATAIFDAAKQLIGRVPGGLGVATIISGAGMSAASGSTLGVTYATSRIAVPEMLRAGYSPRVAAGTVTMAGTLKMLIPPSVTVVIYAGLVQTPVGPQLLAGIVPGLMLALIYAVLLIVRSILNPSLAPRIDTGEFTVRTRLVSILKCWPVAIIMVVIIGGIYSGLATATEAGALAALATVIVAAWTTRKDGFQAYVRLVWKALSATVTATAVIMFLLIGGQILTLMVSLSGVMQSASAAIGALQVDRVAFLLILVVMYIVLGMFMDELPMMLLTVPILIPILVQLDVDLIWFGVFLILLCEVGMVVPPVGILSFVVHNIVQRPEVNLGRSISLVDVFRGVFPFVVAAIGLIVLLIFWPDLALWLPSAMQTR
jgi:C4-dicarboxylate transporter DctM subunit